MRKQILLILTVAVLPIMIQAQELNARVSINAGRVSSQTDKKVFSTLQNTITNFLNTRKWTNETFQANEKINCNFLVNILEAQPGNIYKATLTVQAARPVFNTNYETPLINFQDDGLTFRYVEFQPFEFNDNRVSGSDPLVSNLSAVFAYYVYMILGLDFNSFSLRGGDPYFQKAQNVVNNAPENRDITGWKAFDGLRNRYWLVENLVNNRYNSIHEAMYSYYRLGMDHMYENENEGRTAVLNTLSMLNSLNNDIGNTMIIPFFLQGKSQELIRIFKKATPEEKQKARDILQKIDISNANTYKSELK
ncbi:DUF4835 family protein [Pseudobacter ginsenosidimutans]|uniref:Uncharacterized protein DUF4835 n=1 Tax=Pseudobacter ginsenosidimutans TaxID=661488 RepID=A0A4Q7MLL9_9BACT|nr:DUF4835 family protein [Pseudobacter ginsenosidimutans]QEC40502.1 DUF4835 family protein [Pseudobacter ginsenosidimutans]RZS68887.1 uncharacterized protein DUF4835 [Pseudobacter ginsenosidimutans]